MNSAGSFHRILLVSPRYTLFDKDVRRAVPPIGLACLAAFLEAHGYEVGVLDIATEGHANVVRDGLFVTYGLADDDVRQRIRDFRPDVVGVSCIFSTQFENMKHALDLVKAVDDQIVTLVGGSHPTYGVEDVLACKTVDYVIQGEGELPTLALLTALNEGGDVSSVHALAYREGGALRINRELQYVEDIDSLPAPARHLLNMEQYFRINLPQNPYPRGKRVAQIMSSRGCAAKCCFCTTTNFWGNRYRGRSAERVVAEIRGLIEDYGVDEIQFTDDNLTLNKKRAMAIVAGIKPLKIDWCVPQGVAVWALDDELLERMRESGCYQLTFAVESGNQSVLDNIIKKPLKLSSVRALAAKALDLGIKIHAFCICGLPGETIDQMNETYEFVSECRFDSASFFAATPLLGSDLLRTCQEGGFLRVGMTCNDQLYKIGNINTPEFDAGQVEELVAKFNRSYNAGDTRAKSFREDLY